MLVAASAVVGRVSLSVPGLGRLVTAMTSHGGFLALTGLTGTLYALSLLAKRRLRTETGRTLAGIDARATGAG